MSLGYLSKLRDSVILRTMLLIDYKTLLLWTIRLSDCKTVLLRTILLSNYITPFVVNAPRRLQNFPSRDNGPRWLQNSFSGQCSSATKKLSYTGECSSRPPHELCKYFFCWVHCKLIFVDVFPLLKINLTIFFFVCCLLSFSISLWDNIPPTMLPDGHQMQHNSILK